MLSLPLVGDKPVAPTLSTKPADLSLVEPTPDCWASPPWDREHPVWIYLDEDLDPDHLVRFLDLFVDQLDLEPLFRSYSGRGSPPCPPQLLVKLVLYQYACGRPSPDQWLEATKEFNPVSWLLFGLRPARSTLYDFRDRIAPFIDDWNEQLLDTVTAEGYSDGSRGGLDGTFFPAHASRHHLLGESALRRRCQLLEEVVTEDNYSFPVARQRLSPLTWWWVLVVVAVLTTPTPTANAPGEPDITRTQFLRLLVPPRLYPRWLAGTPQGRREQLGGMRRALRRWRAKNKKHQAKQSRRAKKRRRGSDKVVVCVSEPEAALGRDKKKVFRPLYNVQLLRDLDSPFILAYGTFTAVSDTGLLPVMLQRCERLVGWMPGEVAADPAYATALDLAYCESKDVRLYAPDASQEAKKKAKKEAKGSAQAGKEEKKYGKEEFRYDSARDEYVCPMGQKLQRKRSQSESRGGGKQMVVMQYRAEASACSACAQRQRCTKDARGRTVKRGEHEGLVEQLQKRMATEEGKSTYRLRKQTVELAIAQLKKILPGDEPLTSYGKPRARTQVGLAVLLLNALELFKARQRAGRDPLAPLRSA
jgi:transposase